MSHATSKYSFTLQIPYRSSESELQLCSISWKVCVYYLWMIWYQLTSFPKIRKFLQWNNAWRAILSTGLDSVACHPLPWIELSTTQICRTTTPPNSLISNVKIIWKNVIGEKSFIYKFKHKPQQKPKNIPQRANKNK